MRVFRGGNRPGRGIAPESVDTLHLRGRMWRPESMTLPAGKSSQCYALTESFLDAEHLGRCYPRRAIEDGLWCWLSSLFGQGRAVQRGLGPRGL